MIHLYTGSEPQPWAQAAELTREAREQGLPVIVIVPQQYTLTAERALIRALKVEGFFDVDVVSPLRFSQRVFAQAGCDSRTRIDAQGKLMAVSRAVQSCRGRLKYYESAVDRQGFIENAGRMIADMKRARISPEALEGFRKSLSEGALADKFSDLALIYAAYEQLLSGRFVDGEDVQRELIRRLPQAPMANGARVIVAGFDILTEEMAHLLTALRQVSESVRLLMCADADDAACQPAVDSLLRFQESLRESGVPFRTHGLLPAFERPRDIRHLAAQLLKSHPEEYPAPPPSIRLYAAPTPYAEACHAAEELLTLHRQGYSWEDMLVLCADEGHYFSVLDHALSIYRIPHHLARKTVAAHTGAAQFLLSALGAVMRHYPQEDMLRLLKSDYAPVSPDERFRLENVILQYGIRNWKFTKPFVSAKEEGEQLEDARQRLMAPLLGMETAFRQAKSIDDALTALMSFLDEMGVYDRLEADAARLEQEKLLTEAAQLRQVWNALMRLLDQAHDIARQDQPSIEEVYRLLDAGLSGTEIAALPQSAGSLPCGLLGNIAVHHPRVTMILALNDGVLDISERGLIADDEQEKLKTAFKASFALDQDERFQLKRLELQKAVYSPSEKLYLSHAQALQDGTALRPLDLLVRVRRVMPALVEEGGVTAAQGCAHPYGVVPALETIGTHLREAEMPEEWREAWHYLSERLPGETQALCEAFRPAPTPAPLPAELVHSLYLERVTSVHRLESFAVCPFRHFLRYVLKPVPRGEWAVNRTDAGSFYHRALEGFTRELQNLENWPDVTRAQVDRLMDRAAEEALDDLITGVMGDSARQKREYRQYRRLLQRVGWTFTLIARHSAFRAHEGDAELRFGYPDDGLPAVPLRLSDGSRVYLRGIIDRVERYEGDQGMAIRLIDFKTANLSLDPAKIFWGAQLQLLIYMQALLNAEPNGIPAGMYYFRLSDPLLDDPEIQSDIESQLAKALGLKGLTLRDASIIRLMDDGKPPLSMPALLKADGDFAQGKPLATLEEMRLLIQHASNVAAHLAESINTGEIAASPLSFPNEDSPCASCDAYDICRRNAPNTSIVPRTAEKMDLGALIGQITPAE